MPTSSYPIKILKDTTNEHFVPFTMTDGIYYNQTDKLSDILPNTASSSNQLADKAFVNSTISSLSAFYLTKNAAGEAFATKAELTSAETFYYAGTAQSPTKNDYVVVLADESKEGATTRYIAQLSGSTLVWAYQYTVNEKPMTQAQLNAINSGITAAKVAEIDEKVGFDDYPSNDGEQSGVIKRQLLTQAEYDAIPSEEIDAHTEYIITDATPGGGGGGDTTFNVIFTINSSGYMATLSCNKTETELKTLTQQEAKVSLNYNGDTYNCTNWEFVEDEMTGGLGIKLMFEKISSDGSMKYYVCNRPANQLTCTVNEYTPTSEGGDTLPVGGIVKYDGETIPEGYELYEYQEQIEGLPIGTIAQWGTDTAPESWLICDGSAISRTIYSDLFAVIGTTYGAGDGATTFNLPDMRGRVLVGAGTQTDDREETKTFTLAQNLGEYNHLLTINEMPSHQHGSYGWGGCPDNSSYATLGANYSSTSSYNTRPTGGSQVHNNIQPSLVVNFIIKYGQLSTEPLPSEAGIPVGSILDFNGTEDQIPVGYARYEGGLTKSIAKMNTTAIKSYATGSYNYIEYNEQSLNIGNFICDTTNFRIKIPAGTAKYIKITGGIAGKGHHWGYYVITDDNGNNPDGYNDVRDGTLFQSSGNGYYNIPIKTTILELDTTKNWYVQYKIAGYNSQTFDCNSGFNVKGTYIQVEEL